MSEQPSVTAAIRRSWRVYLLALIMFVLSSAAAWTLHTAETLELQGRQELFNLGVASHMATVAFLLRKLYVRWEPRASLLKDTDPALTEHVSSGKCIRSLRT